MDLLIDGPCRQDLAADLPLRGSSNQRLHFLTSRFSPHELERLPRAGWIGGLASARATGFGVAPLVAALAPAGGRP